MQFNSILNFNSILLLEKAQPIQWCVCSTKHTESYKEEKKEKEKITIGKEKIHKIMLDMPLRIVFSCWNAVFKRIIYTKPWICLTFTLFQGSLSVSIIQQAFVFLYMCMYILFHCRCNKRSVKICLHPGKQTTEIKKGMFIHFRLISVKIWPHAVLAKQLTRLFSCIQILEKHFVIRGLSNQLNLAGRNKTEGAWCLYM